MTVRRLLCSGLALVAVQTTATAQASDFYDLSTVRDVELTFAQPDWYARLRANWATKTYLPANITIDGRLYQNVGVRFRGNSSYRALPDSSEKRPFKVALDRYVAGQAHDGYSMLNFNNNYIDPSWVREVTAYRILRRYVPAPKSSYIRLRVNGQTWGPYVNTQQLNGDLLEEWFESATGTRYRGERPAGGDANNSALLWLGADPLAYQRYYELKTPNHPDRWTDLVDLCDKLNRTPLAQRRTVLPTVVDVDNALWFLAGSDTLLWLDSYVGRWCHNFYLYRDPYHGRFSLLPWDMNASFGSHRSNVPASQIPTIAPDWRYTAGFAGRPLMSVLASDPLWRERYMHHVRTIVAEEFNWARLGPEIQALRALIDADVRDDPKSIYGYQLFVDNLTRPVFVTQTRQVPGLQPTVDARQRYLAAHREVAEPAPTLSELAIAPVAPTPGDAVDVTVRVSGPLAPASVTAFWRVRGPFSELAMHDDGQHGDGTAGDGVFGATIPMQAPFERVQYYVGAQSPAAAGGAMAFLPTSASHRAPTYRVGLPAAPVRINEFVARNDSGIRDEQGEREDWIELHNGGSAAIDVGGMHLTDDLNDRQKWQIPSPTVILAGETLLVWADGEVSEGRLHAGFRLSADGEELALVDRDGTTVLDALAFGPQTADVATGRLIDGALPWVTLPAPSPRRANLPNACGSRRFSALDPTGQRATLDLRGQPTIGATVTVRLRGAPPDTPYALAVSANADHIELPFSSSTLLCALPVALVPIGTTDPSGDLDLPLVVPLDPSLIGGRAYLQAWAPAVLGPIGSNALELRFCP